VVEVRTGDRPGLLYALGDALSQAGLSIRSAHVATLAGQAIDTFYLTEPDGSPPSSPREQEALAALVAAARSETVTAA
jgi:[protein-PII] uridylyltransferase